MSWTVVLYLQASGPTAPQKGSDVGLPFRHNCLPQARDARLKDTQREGPRGSGHICTAETATSSLPAASSDPAE